MSKCEREIAKLEKRVAYWKWRHKTETAFLRKVIGVWQERYRVAKSAQKPQVK